MSVDEELRALLKRSLARVAELTQEVQKLQAAEAEPIAIIGMSCRLPGSSNDLEGFWRMLLEGRDAILEIPGARWTAQPGWDAPKWAGLLDDVSGFDAGFFEISPREALSLDPQQRLLLEVVWEAFECAGIPAARLRGSSTGTYVGINTADYARRVYGQPCDALDAYALTGTMNSMAAGRIAYVLGLQGPALAVDTACSSSLVATHLACEALRSSEVDLAVAAGVSLILDPLSMELIARSHALAPDGRCKTFDAAANGYARGEGCAAVALKRLRDAQRDGDHIWAVIRGSATNQDGRSMGLTAPNLLAQQEVIRKALARAGVAPAEIGYVEAHGTGTSLGDPIEVEALTAVLGQPRPDGSPCVLGTVKTNIGHCEAAAGVAGLIKAALVLRRGIIPRHLNFKTLNPRISLEGTPFSIPVQQRSWTSGGKRRYAGVSSFGLSGTNAHAVLEEAGPAPAPTPQAPDLFLLPLSGRSEGALAAQVARFRDHLRREPAQPLTDVCRTAAVGRTHFEERLVLLAPSREVLQERLGVFLEGKPAEGIVRGRALGGDKSTAFVFSGYGAQWLGMGRELYEREAIFRRAVDDCQAALGRHVSWNVVEILKGGATAEVLEQADVLQPAVFTLQVALAALWRSWGIEPAAVVGHSLGEVSAAYVAGALSLDDAALVICERGRITKKASGRGGMALLELPATEAEQLLADYPGRLVVGAINGPASTVVSGDGPAVDELLARLEKKGVFCRRVRMDYASHSHHMDPLLGELGGALKGLSPSIPTVPLYSTVTGSQSQALMGAEYWERNLRQPVQFWPAVEGLWKDGYRAFLEVSSHPVLLSAIRQGLGPRARSGEAATAGSLLRDRPAVQSMFEGLAQLHAQGVNVDWRRIYPQGTTVPLPTYPFQREEYWMELGGDGPTRASGPSAEVEGEAERARAERVREREAWRSAQPAERGPMLSRILARELGSVLRQDFTRIEPTRPFGSLGMDSLTAAELRDRLSEALGLALPTAIFWKYPTVAALTEHLSAPDGAVEAPSALVPLQTGGSRPPIFFVHPVGGGVLCYRPLVERLGPEQPFYGLQAKGLEPTEQPEETIEQMAASYLAAIRGVQPAGPYHLGGWSFGGLVAYQMATQLLEQGEEVAPLLMVDSYGPGSPWASADPLGLLHFFACAEGLPLGEAEIRGLGFEAALSRIDQLLRQKRNLPASADGSRAIRRMLDLQAANDRAFRSFRPRPLGIAATLIRATQAHPLVPRMTDRSLGWSPLVPRGLNVQQLDGDHFSIVVEPRVTELARMVRAHWS